MFLLSIMGNSPLWGGGNLLCEKVSLLKLPINGGVGHKKFVVGELLNIKESIAYLIATLFGHVYVAKSSTTAFRNLTLSYLLFVGLDQLLASKSIDAIEFILQLLALISFYKVACDHIVGRVAVAYDHYTFA